MKRFGATISEEEEEEEVVHIPSPYKVKPRSKFFCFLFSPFCFYRCKKLMLLFYSKFSILICAFVFLHPSWRKQNTIFNCQKNGGWVTAGASRNPPDALPVSSVFPFFSFFLLIIIIYRDIYKVFTLFLFFVFPWATFWTFNSSALIRSSWKNVRWLFDLLHLCWNWSLSCEASSQGPAGLRVTHIVRRAVHPSSAVELLQWLLIL